MTLKDLSVDLFGHVLGFLAPDEKRALPVCSKVCRELWVEHAKYEIQCLEKDFIPDEYYQNYMRLRFHAIEKEYKNQDTSVEPNALRPSWIPDCLKDLPAGALSLLESYLTPEEKEIIRALWLELVEKDIRRLERGLKGNKTYITLRYFSIQQEYKSQFDRDVNKLRPEQYYFVTQQQNGYQLLANAVQSLLNRSPVPGREAKMLFSCSVVLTGLSCDFIDDDFTPADHRNTEFHVFWHLLNRLESSFRTQDNERVSSLLKNEYCAISMILYSFFMCTEEPSNHHKAKEILAKARNVDPAHPCVQLHVGLNCICSGLLDEGVAIIRQSVQASPAYVLWHQVYWCQLRKARMYAMSCDLHIGRVMLEILRTAFLWYRDAAIGGLVNGLEADLRTIGFAETDILDFVRFFRLNRELDYYAFRRDYQYL